MEQSRKTPDLSPNSGTNSAGGSSISSPLKGHSPTLFGHNRAEITNSVLPSFIQAISMTEMWDLLDYEEGETGKLFTRLPTLRSEQSEETGDRYCELLDTYSTSVKKRLEKESGSRKWKLIQFLDKHSHPPRDHPSGTHAKPDYVAIKLDPEETAPASPYWSTLEATGEFKSSSSRGKEHAQSASYTAFLLQARPDRPTVQGIFIDSTSFRLILTNPCGAFSTESLRWDSRPSKLILCAWIRRLYEPVVDKTVIVDLDLFRRPTFTILCSDVAYVECDILRVGEAFGRRTTVFNSKKTNTVIKEQYVEDRRYNEGDIVHKIHRDGVVPGVVQIGRYGKVESDGAEIVVECNGLKRTKIRMVMLDKGVSFLESSTPREALIAAYDLLEVTRLLTMKRMILHRDISAGNVLLRDVPTTKQFASDLDIYFASYLLKAKSKDLGVDRLDTKLLLIDFDMGEDLERSGKSTKPKPRTGTPLYMARSVRIPEVQPGVYGLCPMPQLTQGRPIYAELLGHRLTAFPDNEMVYYSIWTAKPIEPFQHRLRYEAESVFWVLFHWALLACPAEGPSVPIPYVVWNNFTGGSQHTDTRNSLVDKSPVMFLHPAYKSLEQLFADMAMQLRGDPSESPGSPDPIRMKDEYLHEAFQRLIFEFLVQNYDEPFMAMQSGPEHRQAERSTNMEVSY